MLAACDAVCWMCICTTAALALVRGTGYFCFLDTTCVTFALMLLCGAACPPNSNLSWHAQLLL
jgi:hypothetical protein